jgi:hypothetical protein
VGYLLLIAMGRRGFIGQWLFDWFGITFAFSWRGAVLAAAVMSFPLMVRAIRLALEGVDTKLEQAARTLGAGRWRVFMTITLPLTLPGLLSAPCWPLPVRWVNLGDHHLCLKHPWRNAHHSFGDVHPYSDTRRRNGGGAFVCDLHYSGACLAAHFGMAGAR